MDLPFKRFVSEIEDCMGALTYWEDAKIHAIHARLCYQDTRGNAVPDCVTCVFENEDPDTEPCLFCTRADSHYKLRRKGPNEDYAGNHKEG